MYQNPSSTSKLLPPPRIHVDLARTNCHLPSLTTFTYTNPPFTKKPPLHSPCEKKLASRPLPHLPLRDHPNPLAAPKRLIATPLQIYIYALAPGGEYSLDRADRLARVANEEGDVAELRHAREELHVLGEAALVLEGRVVGVVRRYRRARGRGLRHGCCWIILLLLVLLVASRLRVTALQQRRRLRIYTQTSSSKRALVLIGHVYK